VVNVSNRPHTGRTSGIMLTLDWSTFVEPFATFEFPESAVDLAPRPGSQYPTPAFPADS
jgi:hypothetical protein